MSDLDNDPDLCSAAFHAAMVHPAFTPDMRKTIGDTLDVVLSNFQTEVGEKGAVLKHDQAYPASAVPIRIESDPRKKGNYVFVLQASCGMAFRALLSSSSHVLSLVGLVE